MKLGFRLSMIIGPIQRISAILLFMVVFRSLSPCIMTIFCLILLGARGFCSCGRSLLRFRLCIGLAMMLFFMSFSVIGLFMDGILDLSTFHPSISTSTSTPHQTHHPLIPSIPPLYLKFVHQIF